MSKLNSTSPNSLHEPTATVDHDSDAPDLLHQPTATVNDDSNASDSLHQPTPTVDDAPDLLHQPGTTINDAGNDIDDVPTLDVSNPGPASASPPSDGTSSDNITNYRHI